MTQPHVHDWPANGRDGMSLGPATCSICGASLNSVSCGYAADGLMPSRRIYAEELRTLCAEAEKVEPHDGTMPALLKALGAANERQSGETAQLPRSEVHALHALLTAANERGVTLNA